MPWWAVCSTWPGTLFCTGPFQMQKAIGAAPETGPGNPVLTSAPQSEGPVYMTSCPGMRLKGGGRTLYPRCWILASAWPHTRNTRCRPHSHQLRHTDDGMNPAGQGRVRVMADLGPTPHRWWWWRDILKSRTRDPQRVVLRSRRTGIYIGRERFRCFCSRADLHMVCLRNPCVTPA